MPRSTGRPRQDQITPRDDLLNAACQLALEQGFAELTTRKIANRADTTTAMIRYYFQDKQGLCLAALEIICTPLQQEIQRLSSSESVKVFWECFCRLRAQLLTEQDRSQLLANELLRPGFSPLKLYIKQQLVIH
ncbi:TetR/AcrR family transcriptional regulator [Dongshaea marina]|uniref:TetR/AcrR family transcriptional regulator n=1 Tax=Dongshaea marina TaxID=2047966 RepID=UPI000D3E417A|nr:TetR/AcrR family transcriptional regulator [Dongshaea marina]